MEGIEDVSEPSNKASGGKVDETEEDQTSQWHDEELHKAQSLGGNLQRESKSGHFGGPLLIVIFKQQA
jgi:hypothetical protein